MKTFRLGNRVLVGVVLLLLLVAGGMLFFQYSSQSHHDFKKNSLAYFLLLDDEIANISALMPQIDINFTAIPQDGTAPGVNAASIATPDQAHAKQEIIDWFIHLGYREQTQCEAVCTVVWLKGDATISIYPEKNRLTVLKTTLALK